MPSRHNTMMNPSIEDLLSKVDSKFTLVTLGSMRARQINSYFNQLGEGLGSAVPPQVRKLQLQSQLVYRKSYRSDSIAEKTVLLRNTALEAMRAYGTDNTRRMYFIEYPISAPLEVAFCVAVPPGSKGEFVTLLPPTDVLSIYHHGAYEDLPAVGQLAHHQP